MKNVELGDLKDGGVQIKPFIHCYCSMLENLMISPSCSLSHHPDRPKGPLFCFFHGTLCDDEEIGTNKSFV